MEMEGVKSVNITYNLGKMLPACWTSSYRSIMEQPRRVSSLKNISNFLNSSNARISNKSSITKKKKKPTNQQSHRKINCVLIKENGSDRERERETHRVHSICEGKASKSEARRASEPSISRHLEDCSSPKQQQKKNCQNRRN